jgi:hypothetical protein
MGKLMCSANDRDAGRLMMPRVFVKGLSSHDRHASGPVMLQRL